MSIQRGRYRSGKRKLGARKPSRSTRRTIETLEPRTLLAAIIWNTDSDGNWNDASNWSGGAVPGVTDTVTIDRAAANPIISISSNVRVASLTSSETIVINNNVVNGSVQVTGEMVMSEGELRWSDGDLRVGSLDINSGATFLIQTDGDDGFAGALTNSGIVNQTSLMEIALPRTTFRNEIDGSWNLENEFRAATGFSIVFTNLGTFRRTGDTPTQFYNGDRFDHIAGSRIEVSSGEMFLPISGLIANPSSGAFFDVAAGALLDLNTGTSYWIGTYTGTGDGRIEISRGTLSLEDPAGGTGVTFDFPEGLFHWTGGTIRTDTLTGDLFINEGHMTWSGDGERTLRGAAFHNRGTVLQTDAGNTLTASIGVATQINNEANATFELRGTGDIIGGKFLNEGIFPNTFGDSELKTLLVTRDGSSLEVTQGRLQLTGGGEFASSSFQATGDGVIEFNNPPGTANFSLQAGAVVTGMGTGRIELSGGRIDSTNSDATLDFDDGLFFWTGGEFFHDIVNVGQVTIAGSGDKRILNAFANQGTVVQLPTTTVQASSSGFVNAVGALWEIQDDAKIVGAAFTTAKFKNAGVLRKTGSGVATIVEASVSLVHEGGTIDVAAGSLVASHSNNTVSSGGHFVVATGATFEIQGNLASTGRYTGEGGGSVIAAARLEGKDRTFTLDFPEGMFQWSTPTGQESTLGWITNDGHLTLNAENHPVIATFVNNGTVVQTDGTNLRQRNVSRTINYGDWEFQGDATIELNEFDSVGANFTNFGTITKTNGGTTAIIGTGGARPSFNNFGTVNVVDGIVSIEASHLGQFDSASQTLHGGTWNIGQSSSLTFIDDELMNVPVRTSYASVRLSGTGSTFPSFDSLEINGGRLEIANGQSLVKADDFINGVQRTSLTLEEIRYAKSNFLVGLAAIPGTNQVWTHSLNDRVGAETFFRRIGSGLQETGTPIVQPGGAVSFSGLDVTTASLNIGGTLVPAGSLLFVHGTETPPVLFALDQRSGAVLASVSMTDVPTGLVGVAHHPSRESVFVVGKDSIIREINTVDGSTRNSFPIQPNGSSFFGINFGGVDVVAQTGNLLLVGSSQRRVRELTPTGVFVRDIDLTFSGITAKSSFSDISYDDATAETWISSDEGVVYRFAPVARGVFGSLSLDSASQLTVGGDFTSIGNLQLAIADRPATDKFSKITVSGSATLGGIFQVVPGSYFESVSGDTYQLISFADRTSDFDQVFSKDFETLVEDASVFAFADRAPSIDLVASEVTGPTSVVVGDIATIQWTVTNLGNDPAVGPWYDEVRLQSVLNDPITIDGFEVANFTIPEVVLGGIIVGQGLTLNRFESATFSLDVPVGAALIGDYRWVVETNRRANVLETEGRSNNVAVATENAALDFRALPSDGTVVRGQFAGRRMPQHYKIDVPANTDLLVELAMTSTGDTVNELYISKDYVPTRNNYVARHQQVGSQDVSLVVDGAAQTQTWFITAFPASFDAANTNFDLTARVVPPSLISVAPDRVGNSGQATIKFTGSRLNPTLTYQLISPSGAARVPLSLDRIDAETVFAYFELDGLVAGAYDVVASDAGGVVSTLEDAVVVEPTRVDKIEINLIGSTRIRSGRTGTYTVTYHNPSNVDMQLPFITAKVEGGGTLRGRYDSEIRSEELLLLAPPVVPGTSIIPPGVTGTVRLYYDVPLDEGDFAISVWGNSIDEPTFANRPLNWDAFAVNLKPAGSDDAAWATYMASERARYGETFADLYAFLADQVEELGRNGFRNLLFVNGQWFFDFPETPPGPGPTRGIFEVSADSKSFPTSSVFSRPNAEAESNGDGRQNVFAVVVGDPDGSLPDAQRDGNAWNDFFTKTLNLDGSDSDSPNVFVDSDGSANGDEFLARIASVKERADSDDLIFVTYAGHGVCRRDGANNITGGEILFPDRRITGAQMQEALAGQTRTVAVIDSCYSAAFTEEIVAPNVTSVAGSDWNQQVDDYNSLTRNLLPVLLKNPQQEIHEAIRQAGTAQYSEDLQRRLRNPKQRDKAESHFQNTRDGKIDRNRSVNESIEFEEKQFSSRIVDTTGDGRGDSIQIDRDNDGTFDAIIRDRDNDGELKSQDVSPNQFFADSRDRIDVESLSAEDRARYDAFRDWEEGKSQANAYRGVASPVLDARGGELELNNSDIKDKKGAGGGTGGGTGGGGNGGGGGGGATDDVSDTQKTEVPQRTVRGQRGRSFDPNEKVGPSGIGSAGFIDDDLLMPFTIFFENDPVRATLPAQEVTVTEVLDDDLDLTTFELGDIIVGSRFIDVPEGRSAWSTIEFIVVSDYPLELHIDAELDFITRTVTWTFTSIDPATGFLTQEFEAGFLPVNDEFGSGEANVGYRVRAKTGLPSGTEITGSASIVFDVNEPLITNSTLNTIDIVAPTSSVSALAASSTLPFTVTWTGDDDTGSGVATFDIFVSQNDGPFQLWLENTSAASAEYLGKLGVRYAFYSIATDHLGLTESGKTVADTSTLATAGPWTNPADIYDVNDRDGVTSLDALLVINELSLRRFSDRATGRLDAATPTDRTWFYYDVSLDGNASALDALRVINQLARIGVSSLPKVEAEDVIRSPITIASSSEEADLQANQDSPIEEPLTPKQAAFDFAIRDSRAPLPLIADTTEEAIVIEDWFGHHCPIRVRVPADA